MVGKKSLKKKFIKFFSIILAVSLILEGSIFVFLFNAKSASAYDPSKQVQDWERVGTENVMANESKSISAPARTNFLIVGLDKSAGLTDTIMVGSYLAATGDINLMSIPRDTYVVLESNKIKKLNEFGRSAPNVTKINSIYVYAGDQKHINDKGKEEPLGITYLRQEVEELLEVTVDYTVTVDLQAFESIVDTIGGIEFNVPQRLYYSDPTQGLLIDLQPGIQTLNGKQAEGLVRYRKGYARQDLQRVEIQQEFVKEFIKQVLNKETIMDNIIGLISNFMEYVETDVTLTDVYKYKDYISKINGSGIQTTTLPGYATMVDDLSYYMPDKSELKVIVDDYFFGIKDIEDESEASSEEPEDNSDN